MNAIFRKNESETNEIAAKAFLIMYGFLLLIALFDWVGIFDIQSNMIMTATITLSAPLLFPAVLVYIFHMNKAWLKYLLIVSLSVVTGVCYYIFTFQAVILFVIPSIIASFYMNRKVLYFSAVTTCMAIVLSHIASGIYLFQPWIEPFPDMRAIIQYGAVPRCMQYLLYFILLNIMNKRHLGFMEKLNQTVQEERQVMQENIDAIQKELAEKVVVCNVEAGKDVNTKFSAEFNTELNVPLNAPKISLDTEFKIEQNLKKVHTNNEYINNEHISRETENNGNVNKENVNVGNADKRIVNSELEAEFNRLLSLLTEREKDVFMLIINGCTNMQIADKLCLSMGTVKNYVSTIYDKIGNRERNYIILKYSRFYREND